MYHLATIFPFVKKIKIPVTRDQAMLLFMALNELLLGLETYLAHLISGTIVPNEYFPIIFGPVAGVLLLIAGLIARRKRTLATIIALITFIASIIIGILGAYFHIARALLPNAAGEYIFSVPLLIWAPPFLGPITFALVGLVGISSLFIEDPVDSGTLRLFGKYKVMMPYSKTRAFFLMVSLASLATTISSVLDHARTDFTNLWLWVPTGIGFLAVVIAALLGSIEKPRRSDLIIYTVVMVVMALIGVLGVILHVDRNLTTQGKVVVERFLRGAPFMAPMLFSDIATIGLIILMDPNEKALDKSSEDVVS